MKRLTALIFAIVVLVSSQCYAQTRRTVTKDVHGTMSHVTAYQTDSGQTVFVVDGLGNVTFYMTNIIPLSGGSLYFIGSSTSGYYARYNSSSSVTGAASIDASVLYGIAKSGVSTEQEITGKTYYTDMSNSATISGQTLFGGAIGNWGATNEVTATLPTAVKGMSVFFALTQGQINGCTILAVVNSGDNLLGVTSTFSSANSAFYLTGTTMSSYLQLEAWRDGYWYATGVSGIRYRNK